MKEKTFREVIEEKKDGGVWETSGGYKIKRVNWEMDSVIEVVGQSGITIGFYDKDKFTKQHRVYSFMEAIELAKEGKTLESVETGTLFDKFDFVEDRMFTVKEIQGKWTIAD